MQIKMRLKSNSKNTKFLGHCHWSDKASERGSLKNVFLRCFSGCKDLFWDVFQPVKDEGVGKVTCWRPANLLKINCNVIFKWFQKQLSAGVLQNWCPSKFCKIHRKSSVLESLFNKTVDLKPATLLKENSSLGKYSRATICIEHLWPTGARILLKEVKFFSIFKV